MNNVVAESVVVNMLGTPPRMKGFEITSFHSVNSSGETVEIRDWGQVGKTVYCDVCHRGRWYDSLSG